MLEMKILFFHLDAGFFKPQNGQVATERLMSLRQLGQSREFFRLVFDICVYYPNISMVVDENIYFTVTNTRNYIAWEASVGKIPPDDFNRLEITKGPRQYSVFGPFVD